MPQLQGIYMGYSLPSDVAPRKRTPGVFRARPKTHTPGSQLQERGYRYYKPELGRWLSRDVMSERGGINLFGFVGNSPVDRIDILGMEPIHVEYPITLGNCGNFWVEGGAKFTGMQAGWLIQHFKETKKIKKRGKLTKDANTGKSTCECCEDVEDPKEEVIREGYESWDYNGVSAYDGHGGKELLCTDGELRIEKTLVFFASSQLKTRSDGCPEGFTKGGNGDAAGTGGCQAKDPPKGWEDQKMNNKGTVTWGHRATWSCCPNAQTTTTVTPL